MANLDKESILFWSRKYDQEEIAYSSGLEKDLGNKQHQRAPK